MGSALAGEKGDAPWEDLAIRLWAIASLLLIPYQGAQGSWTQEGLSFLGPLGPFMLLDGYPSASVMAALHAGYAASQLALIAFPHVRALRIVAGLFAVITEGVRFSAGKIDHGLLWVAFPLFLAFSRHRGGKYDPRFLMFGVALMYLTAGVIKAMTGWLDPSYGAVTGWMEMYPETYGMVPLVDLTAIESPLYREFLDWSVVLAEVGIGLAIVSGRFARLALWGLPLFHLAIALTMSINFSRLLIVYAPLLFLGASLEQEKRGKPWAWWGVAAGLGIWILVQGGTFSVWRWIPRVGHLPMLALFAIPYFAVAWSRRRALVGPVRRRSATIAVCLAVVSCLTTLAVGEPFPFPNGPAFYGFVERGPCAYRYYQKIELLDRDGAWTDDVPNWFLRMSRARFRIFMRYRFPLLRDGAGGPFSSLDVLKIHGHRMHNRLYDQDELHDSVQRAIRRHLQSSKQGFRALRVRWVEEPFGYHCHETARSLRGEHIVSVGP